MILTVTLNTALDLTYQVPALVPGASHRVGEVAERAGGKGLNVARVLGALGHRTTVTGLCGGATGERVRALLARAEGVEDALVPIREPSRRTVTVTEGPGAVRPAGATVFNEPGPLVGAEEWTTFRRTYATLLGEATAVALCGSLPPGLPVGTYASLVREARAASVPVLLDTSGEALRRGVAARPDVVKPNAEELAQLTGSREPARAARDARRRGARAVVASLGAEGLLAATAEGMWRAAVPRRIEGNATGAGDSVVAGLLSALAERLPWPQRLARATALACATVHAPVAGEFDRGVYAELLPRVRVTELRVG
ncbi:1-phosphofructokinase family hexose kinase [Streptomyces sp. NPDC049954]|uniref:1-phosphofructokinase family hexose kinase n=1 Tax=Streptomyces sp. NPDC049954 TaxID=3155779 RepID=UPI00343FDC2F